MTDNPYASPADHSSFAKELDSEAAKQIRVVIRILRYIGWPLAILLCPLSLFFLTTTILFAFIRPDARLADGVVFGVILLGLSGYFVFALRVASRMARRDPNVRFKAYLVLTPLLLGFPLFTIVALLCMAKIGRYYGDFCEEAASDVGQVANLRE